MIEFLSIWFQEKSTRMQNLKICQGKRTMQGICQQCWKKRKSKLGNLIKSFHLLGSIVTMLYAEQNAIQCVIYLSHPSNGLIFITTITLLFLIITLHLVFKQTNTWSNIWSNIILQIWGFVIFSSFLSLIQPQRSFGTSQFCVDQQMHLSQPRIVVFIALQWIKQGLF